MIERPRTTVFAAMDFGGRHPGLFRRNQPCLVTGAYPDGDRHAPEVAEGWIHGKARPLPDRSRGATGGHRLTCDGKSGSGRTGKTAQSTLPAEHQTRPTRQSASGPLCGRLHHYREFTCTPGTRGQTACGTVSAHARAGTFSDENPSHLY